MAREPVVFSGTLRGAGREATCTVRATKVSLPGSNAVGYANYSIGTVSEELPDGDYELVVNGETIPLVHSMRGWLSR